MSVAPRARFKMVERSIGAATGRERATSTRSRPVAAPSATHFLPPLPDLFRGRGAGCPDLLNGDRRDQVPERRRLLVRRPGHHRAGDPGAATVAGAADVDGTSNRVGGN